MTAITFDTLSTARRLREKGMLQEHAEAIADELRMASQMDVVHLSTKEEVSAFKSEMRGDFALMRSEMREMESRLRLYMGTLIGALGGILIAIKYFG